MNALSYMEWMERARKHVSDGLPIDAMLCLRQAVRADPAQLEARVELARILERLGRLRDAIQVWVEAAHAVPDAFAPRLALAEAALQGGDAPAAQRWADEALARDPGSLRAALTRAVARIVIARAAGDSEVDASTLWSGVRDALEAEPALVAGSPIAASLAREVDSWPASATPAIVSVVAKMLVEQPVPELPSPWLAIVAERHAFADDAQSRRFWRCAAEQNRAAESPDVLRRLAKAAHEAGIGVLAEALARRYADACVNAFRPEVPLTWPRRTAGPARLLLLVSAEITPWLRAEMAELGASGKAVEITVAIVGDAGSDDPRSLPAGVLRTLLLGSNPEIAEAQTLAALDADVLVDAIGLAGSVGPLLVQRPARAVLTLDSVVPANPVPLVDRSVPSLAPGLASLAGPDDPAMPDPAAMSARFADAVRLHRDGDLAEAMRGYTAVLALQPSYAPALYLRGLVQRDTGHLAEAMSDLRQAVEAAPNYRQARLAAVRAALDTGTPDLALSLAQPELAQSASSAPFWAATGLAWLARDDDRRAEAALLESLNRDVSNGEAHFNHGVVLQRQRRLGEASRAYQRAIAFRPDLVDAHFNLGVVFQEQGMHGAALAAYRHVLATNPRHVQAYRHAGEVLFSAADLHAWLANFREFEANCPNALALTVQALSVCQHWGLFDRLDWYLEQLRKWQFDPVTDAELVDALEELLYLLCFFDIRPELMRDLSRRYDAAARAVYGEPLPRSAERRLGRLRIGYLSADLRDHVMGKMMWEVVRRHDRSRYEIFLYSLSEMEDAWTARYRALGDRFESLAADSNTRAALRIAGDDLDVLVDLGTHTRGARPGILARKPARVQVTHVASAGALGLSAIDFKLTDGFADTELSQQYIIEPLLPVEGCIYPYRHIAAEGTDRYRREVFGISADAVVIGAFVSPLKLSRRCLGLWREILSSIPTAVLAVSPMRPELRLCFLRLVQAAGIPADRLALIPQGRTEGENQARYALVDFVLDPLPFGGVNGTLEALDMGVPVVTLCGERHGERTSYSILRNLGVIDTIANSSTEYIEIARRLATDSEFIQTVRVKIRGGFASSRLTDIEAHTRNLERAYEMAFASRWTGAPLIGEER